MSETTLYLLRHAQSSPSADLPKPEWPLSETGIIQAQNIVEDLKEYGIEEIFSSPFLRATETVRPFCEQTNTPFQIVEDLKERKLKEVSMIDDWQLLIEKSWSDLSFALPNCESGFACQKRIAGCLSNLVKLNKNKTLLISSHGNAIGLYLNKLNPSFGFKEWRKMRNPDLFRIIFLNSIPEWDTGHVFHG